MSSSSTHVVQTRSYQDPLETWSGKFARKFKENPWVPLGCLATCAALVMSAAKLRAGKSKDMNYWLRARVVLQGLTLAALVGGSMAVQNARKSGIEGSAVDTEGGTPGADGKTKEMEKLEFEERLKEAERADEEEAALLRVVKGPALRNQAQGPSTSSAQADGPTTAAVKKSSSWLWWTKGSDPEKQDDKKA